LHKQFLQHSFNDICDFVYDFNRGFPLPLEEIDAIAGHYKDALRSGTHHLFKELDELQIPCLVFSAGLGDCVLSVLKHAKIMYPNVKVC
jgi:cytosolic 5'-nucleotidase 3